MNAVALPTSPQSAPNNGWLDLFTAAQRSGRNRKHLARICGEQLLAKGLARLTKPARGKRVWEIHESALPAESCLRLPAATDPNELDMRPFTDAQRASILRREEAVKRWEQTIGTTARGNWDEATDRLVEQLRSEGFETISRPSLYLWRDRYRASKRAGLVDARWATARSVLSNGDSSAGEPSAHAAFLAELERFYRDGNQPTIRSCYISTCSIARRRDWAIPSVHIARRYLNKLRRSTLTHSRQGPKAFDDKHAAYIQRDYTRIVDGGVERDMCTDDIWCADHHICDTIVQHEGKLIRPWMTAFEDLRSRRIIGYRFWATAPNSSSVLLTLKTGIENAGLSVPRFCYTDNGKDFDAYFLQGMTKFERRRVHIEHDVELFKGVYGLLGIEVWHAIAFNAKAKPIEPWFGTFEEQFGKLTRTYCGRNPQEKPHHLADRLKRGEAPSFEDYARDAADYIERIYHLSPHSGHGMDGRTPAEIYAGCRGEIRTTTKEQLDACLMKTAKPVIVGRGGAVKFDGRTYGMADPVMIPWQGKQVRLFIDPNDITSVCARTLDGAFIATLSETRLAAWGSMNEEKHRDLQRRARSYNKKAKEVQSQGMRLHMDPLDLHIQETAIAASSSKRPPLPPAAPSSIKPIRTGLETPANEPEPLRLAVGADARRLPTLEELRARVQPRDRDETEAGGRADPMAKLRESNHAW